MLLALLAVAVITLTVIVASTLTGEPVDIGQAPAPQPKDDRNDDKNKDKNRGKQKRPVTKMAPLPVCKSEPLKIEVKSQGSPKSIQNQQIRR